MGIFHPRDAELPCLEINYLAIVWNNLMCSFCLTLKKVEWFLP